MTRGFQLTLVLVVFFDKIFEFSESVEYSTVEISVGLAWLVVNVMYFDKRENRIIRNLMKIEGM